MNLLKKLVNPKSAKKLAVELSRNCFINGVSHAAGEILELSEREAREIVASGGGVDLSADEAATLESARLNSLLPPPVEPQPLPESWKSFPASFHELWQLEQAAEALVARRGLIWERLLVTMKQHPALGESLANFGASYKLADSATRSKLRDAVANVYVGRPSESHLRAVKFLKDAYERAEQAVRDWNFSNGERWQVAKYHASQHLLERHGATCKGIRELHALGREIFAERIKALGLSESKISELFRGSSDAVRFASIEPPTLDDLRLAFADESGPSYYVEKSPANMVQLLQTWAATEAEVVRLTVEAKKELVRVRKVSGAA